LPGKPEHRKRDPNEDLDIFGKRDAQDVEGKRNGMERSKRYSSRQ
jgi:hypothetical protein